MLGGMVHLRRKSMTKPLTTLIFCTLLAACATQPKQDKVAYSDNEVVYPYHPDGVNCYGLSIHSVRVGSGGQCIEMIMQRYIDYLGYIQE